MAGKGRVDPVAKSSDIAFGALERLEASVAERLGDLGRIENRREEVLGLRRGMAAPPGFDARELE